jgi:uncharacterized membrane protein YecN with MAPEG domain
MELVAIVSLLIFIQYMLFGAQAGLAHGKAKIPAPKMTGEINLEKRVRIQANTTEQMITFVPAMWMFATYIHIEAAAALGVAFIIGRQIFAWGYMQEDGGKRTPGFLITFLAGVITVLGALGGAIYKLAA